jgi:citrate synthase
MDVLQAAVPVLAMQDSELEDQTKEGNYRKALRLVARLPLVVSAWDRIRNGKEVVEADPELSEAANFLYTLHGSVPDPEAERTMDLILILHAEHSFNASTFTARQIASTRAHIYAAIAGALGSLSGELHGGANTRVYNMLQEIGSVENVRDYVTSTLDAGGRIMGMGHAVYQVTDPRAEILGPMAEKLATKAGQPELYEIAREVSRITTEEMDARKGRKIYPNVDFYSALVNYLIGIPVDLFTPVFAAGRVSGWCAHYLEERFGEAAAKPTLYRPAAEYVGRYCGEQACEWIELDER